MILSFLIGILLSVLTDMNEVATALFFGGFSWLGLLIMLMFIVGLTMAWKYMGLLMLVPTVIFATVYFTNGLGWHGFVMLLTGIFILVHVGMEGKKER